MTSNPKYTTPQSYVLEALETMEKYNITVLPVLEGEDVVGIVHIHDILKSGAL